MTRLCRWRPHWRRPVIAFRYPTEIYDVNPYEAPTNEFAAKRQGPFDRVVRTVAWVAMSSLVVTFLLYPAEPIPLLVRNSLGVVYWLLPLLPFMLYELLCRATPHAGSIARLIANSFARCVLTYVIPFYIFHFIVSQIYSYIASSFWSNFGFHLTARPQIAISFALAGLMVMLYDYRVARRPSISVSIDANHGGG